MVLASTANGGAVLPAPPIEDLLKGIVPPTSDAPVFDPGRDPTATPLTAVSPVPGAAAIDVLGMQFWYEVMLPALGPEAARTAALTWGGEVSVLSPVDGRPCINAEIATASPADGAVLLAGLQAVVASRPVSSAATVAPDVSGATVIVSMCESVEPITDRTIGDSGALLFTAAQREVKVGTDMQSIGLPNTPAAWKCAIQSQRAGSLSEYTPGTTDQDQLAQLNNIVTFCRTAA